MEPTTQELISELRRLRAEFESKEQAAEADRRAADGVMVALVARGLSYEQVAQVAGVKRQRVGVVVANAKAQGSFPAPVVNRG